VGKGTISVFGGGTPPKFEGTFKVSSSPTPVDGDKLSKDDKLELIAKLVTERDLLEKLIEIKNAAEEKAKQKSELPKLKLLKESFSPTLLRNELTIEPRQGFDELGVIEFTANIESPAYGTVAMSDGRWFINDHFIAKGPRLRMLLEPGSYRIQAVGIDIAGNQSTGALNFTVLEAQQRQLKK